MRDLVRLAPPRGQERDDFAAGVLRGMLEDQVQVCVCVYGGGRVCAHAYVHVCVMVGAGTVCARVQRPPLWQPLAL